MARSVDTTHVAANSLVAREIVDEERHGKRRAHYGELLIEELSARLKRDFGN